jgi:hypothetical protein
MEQNDDKLWKAAQKRVAFKRHFATYIIVNLFLWGVWLLNNKSYTGFPWPAWVTLGWGIGVAFNYRGAYYGDDMAVEKEFEKLKKERQG